MCPIPWGPILFYTMGLEKKDLSYFEGIYIATEKGMSKMKWGKSGIDEESVGRSICFWIGCGQHQGKFMHKQDAMASGGQLFFLDNS